MQRNDEACPLLDPSPTHASISVYLQGGASLQLFRGCGKCTPVQKETNHLALWCILPLTMSARLRGPPKKDSSLLRLFRRTPQFEKNAAEEQLRMRRYIWDNAIEIRGKVARSRPEK